MELNITRTKPSCLFVRLVTKKNMHKTKQKLAYRLVFCLVLFMFFFRDSSDEQAFGFSASYYKVFPPNKMRNQEQTQRLIYREDQNKILLTFNAINLMRIFFLTCDKVFSIHNEFVTCYLRIGGKSYWERIELVITNKNYTISYIQILVISLQLIFVVSSKSYYLCM